MGTKTFFYEGLGEKICEIGARTWKGVIVTMVVLELHMYANWNSYIQCHEILALLQPK